VSAKKTWRCCATQNCRTDDTGQEWELLTLGSLSFQKKEVAAMVRGLGSVLAFVACCQLLTGCSQVNEPAKTSGAAKKPETSKADDVPIPLDKWNMAAVEKLFGLEFKSVSFDGSAYTFLVEFTKDVTPEQLKEVQAAFPLGTPEVQSLSKVYVRFLDKDNVQLEKSPYWTALTELTGKKGEAFRLRTAVSAKVKEAVRAEIYLPKEDKSKQKEDK
jgi:hypothetical protein